MSKRVSESGKRKIEATIDKVFENTASDLLGYIPGDQKKTIVFTSKRPTFTLADLFVKAMRDKMPNPNERDVLKGLIRIAYGFISGLKERTKSNVIARIDDHIQDAHKKGQKADPEKITEAINIEMSKARSHMKTIAEAEGTKSRNTGAAMDISRIGASLGNDDPFVYFQMVHDASTCKYCIANHLMPDKVTPKVVRLSEISAGYLSTQDRKDGKLSLAGQHPHCRCTLVILAPGWGFKSGKLNFMGLGHSEFHKQQE